MTRALFVRLTAIAMSAACLSTAQLQSQVVQSDSARKAAKPLFTTDDALLGVGFAAITFAMFPADKWAAGRLRSPSSSENQFINGTTKGFEIIADPGSIVIGSAMYVAGRLTNHNTLQDVGLHMTESVVLGSSATIVLKRLLGRARPFVSNGTDPRDFKFGKGFGDADRQSFPSGHTTAAFAAASSVTSEMKRVYPGSTWIVGPVMYGSATMVGLARMYHNKHWASDVALGAAIGTFSGLKVVRYSHNHPDNPVDRHLLRAMVQPNGDGGQLVGVSIDW